MSDIYEVEGWGVMKAIGQSVAVAEYGMGNIGSIRNMLNYLGYECHTVSTGKEMATAQTIILPGVGHYKKAMTNIKKRELDKALRTAVYERGAYVLGICLGMQLLMEYSEEGDCYGLGFIQGKVKKLSGIKLPIPHMGWNTVEYVDGAKNFYMEGAARYYFVHSYYVHCDNQDNIMATTEYGIKFTSVVRRQNIIGVQFHPEKSHIFGMDFFKKYMEMRECTVIG